MGQLLEVINPIADTGWAGVILLIAVIAIIISILPIILFFKVWGMCNNVKDIKNLLIEIYKEMD